MPSAIDQWIQRVGIAMEEVREEFRVSSYHKAMDRAYMDELRKEFGESRFTIDSVQGFLANCTDMYVYEANGVQLSVLSAKMDKRVALSLFRISTILRLFQIKHDLKIVLLPIHQARKKPGEGEPVSPKHINGAYTYISDGTIYVYRLEEWPKVILHEVLHNVPQLQGIEWSAGHMQRLYGAFGIDRAGCPGACQTILEPTEAVIEAWAIFLHTAFLAIERGKDFGGLLQQELDWNYQQIRWILQKQGTGAWQERTHAFSYIVLRGILLHNLEEFLKMRRPYSPEKLGRFMVQRWGVLRPEVLKLPYRRTRSLRMSRLGDL